MIINSRNYQCLEYAILGARLPESFLSGARIFTFVTQSLYYPVVQHLLTVQLLGNYFEPQLPIEVSQSLVSTSFFRCLDLTSSPLPRSDQLTPMLRCNWTSRLHQLTSVDWSQFHRHHRFTTSIAMLLR